MQTDQFFLHQRRIVTSENSVQVCVASYPSVAHFLVNPESSSGQHLSRCVLFFSTSVFRTILNSTRAGGAWNCLEKPVWGVRGDPRPRSYRCVPRGLAIFLVEVLIYCSIFLSNVTGCSKDELDPGVETEVKSL